MVIDLQRRIELGHGKPMLGTRWTYRERRSDFNDLTYSDLISLIRSRMLTLDNGQAVVILIKRENY